MRITSTFRYLTPTFRREHPGLVVLVLATTACLCIVFIMCFRALFPKPAFTAEDLSFLSSLGAQQAEKAWEHGIPSLAGAEDRRVVRLGLISVVYHYDPETGLPFQDSPF